MRLTELSWSEFQKLDIGDKAGCFCDDVNIFHVLIARQFNREQLDAIGLLATRIRMIAKSESGMKFLQSLLCHKRAMLYFTQPSTRTFLSFCAACQILGLSIGEVRDTATSSEFKGESQEDSVRTFSSYFDLIIMRTKMGGLAERMAWILSNSERPIPIINAGSGKDQHPTQSLLDIYTLQRSFEDKGGIEGKRIVFVGDLARGRTVRSLSALLTNYKNISQCFVAPDQLQISQDILDMLRERGVEFSLSDDFKKEIPSADAIYMTRIQDEWDNESGESGQIDTSSYCFEIKYLQLLKQNAVIMHPFPRRNEIPPEIDHDPRAMYWRQMRNGMWVRAALIATIFNRSKEICDYHENKL